MIARLIAPTEQELKNQRDDLIRRAGMSLDELRRRRTSYTLTGEEMAVLDRVEDIEFLLNG